LSRRCCKCSCELCAGRARTEHRQRGTCDEQGCCNLLLPHTQPGSVTCKRSGSMASDSNEMVVPDCKARPTRAVRTTSAPSARMSTGAHVTSHSPAPLWRAGQMAPRLGRAARSSHAARLDPGASSAAHCARLRRHGTHQKPRVAADTQHPRRCTCALVSSTRVLALMAVTRSSASSDSSKVLDSFSSCVATWTAKAASPQRAIRTRDHVAGACTAETRLDAAQRRARIVACRVEEVVEAPLQPGGYTSRQPQCGGSEWAGQHTRMRAAQAPPRASARFAALMSRHTA
jgi:hypothetical protein